MHERVDNNDILLTHAEKLPEKLLKDFFPDITPDIVRDVLRRLFNNQKNGKDRTNADLQPETGTSRPGLPFPTVNQGSCSLCTDGASRGNPGHAGAGIVLLSEKGSEIAVRSVYLGKCTNNRAEYQALIIGLETALEIGCSSIHFFMDSELIVRQIEGRYKVKSEQLKPLFAKVQGLLAKFTNWQTSYVPRARNTRADQLANKGIDERSLNP